MTTLIIADLIRTIKRDFLNHSRGKWQDREKHHHHHNSTVITNCDVIQNACLLFNNEWRT